MHNIIYYACNAYSYCQEYVSTSAGCYVCAWNLEGLSSITNPGKPSQCLSLSTCVYIMFDIPSGWCYRASRCSRVAILYIWHVTAACSIKPTLVLIRATISGNKDKVLLFLVLLTCLPCSYIVWTWFCSSTETSSIILILCLSLACIIFCSIHNH